MCTIDVAVQLGLVSALNTETFYDLAGKSFYSMKALRRSWVTDPDYAVGLVVNSF